MVMDLKKIDEDKPDSSHSQGQSDQKRIDIIEKGEKPYVPLRYDDGYAIELEKNNEESHRTARRFQTWRREIKHEKGEHQSELERNGVAKDWDNLKHERIPNSNSDAEEDIKKSEGNGRCEVFIKTEAPEEGVNEEEYFGSHHFEEEREAEYDLKEHMLSENLSHSVDEERIEIDNDDEIEEGTLKCTFCLKAFKYRYSLVRHLRIHTGEDLFKCNICEYTTPYNASLQSHIHKHSEDKPFKCNDCDYRTTTSSAFKTHLKRHAGEKPYKCKYCEYSTPDKSNLNTHLRRHTGEKPFKCKYCDYTTSYSASLKTHTRRHSGEKPFQCHICEYSTSYNSHLKSHIRIHTAEKPFKCNICEYRASEKSHLIRHNRKHTGEKPFKCDYCDFNTADSSHLSRHVYRKHSGEKHFSV